MLTRIYKTPAQAGPVLVAGKKAEALSPEMRKKHCSGTGKACMQCSTQNQKLTMQYEIVLRHAWCYKGPQQSHAMCTEVQCGQGRQRSGAQAQQEMGWRPKSQVYHSGRSDLDYAKEPKDRCSISGHMVYHEGAPAMFKSSTERTVPLSTTEAETYAGFTCVQDMIYMKNVLESLGLKVKLPMVLKMDNQGAVYLANNWSIRGRKRHIDVWSVFLQELKDAGVLMIMWIAGTTNEADIFTKNLDGPTFQRCTSIFTGGTDYDWVSNMSNIPVRRSCITVLNTCVQRTSFRNWDDKLNSWHCT